jgi:signal recognition particle subunit SRP54
MFESLSDRLEGAFDILKGNNKITELNIADSVKQIRRALVEADVSFKIAKDFTNTVKAKAIGQGVITAVKPGQAMVKIVRDEMAELMGGQAESLDLTSTPSIILMAGLQGSGKTTHSAKLANYLLRKKSRKPLLVACDVYRPAAINQLQVLGEQLGIEVYAEVGNQDPVNIAENAVKHAKSKGYNTVIVDTAGRLAVDAAMMDEIGRIHKAVVDAMTGQDAVNTAKAFNDVLDFEGVILTKLDGDTRGGAALTIKSVVNKPIKFIGTGEKMEALDVFHPDRMADRILGMGDVVSLVEKAQEQFDEESARKMSKKISQDAFGFDDFMEQIQQIKKMGNMKDLMGMIPGMGKALKNVDIDDDAFKHIEAMINSMTPVERQQPDTINGSRRKRIASGSGRTVQDVNNLLKQFTDMRKVMKMMQSGGGKRGMMNMMRGMR